MIRQFKIIYRKELTDTLRDRRAMMALFFFVVGAPLFLLLVFYMVSLSDEERATRVFVEGLDRAPGLVAFLEKRGIEIKPHVRETQIPGQIPAGGDGILVIPEDYEDLLKTGQPALLTYFSQETSKDSLDRSRAILGAVQGFGSHLVRVRLVSRGIPVVLMQPIQLQTVNIARDNFLSRFMGQFLLLIVIFAPFSSGMSVAIDVLAGERERNSLQPLLALPVSALTLTLGKWAVVATFGITGTLATALILFAELNFMPAELIAFDVHTGPRILLLLILQLVPLAMFVGAMQMFLSILAKSFREAQTLLSIIMMVPFVSIYIKILADDKIPSFVQYLPILSDMESARSLIFEGRMALDHFLIAFLVSLVGTGLALFMTVRRLESERLLDES